MVKMFVNNMRMHRNRPSFGGAAALPFRSAPAA